MSTLESSGVITVPQATKFENVDITSADYSPGHKFWIIASDSGVIKALGWGMNEGEEDLYPLQEGENSTCFKKIFTSVDNTVLEFTSVW